MGVEPLLTNDNYVSSSWWDSSQQQRDFLQDDLSFSLVVLLIVARKYDEEPWKCLLQIYIPSRDENHPSCSARGSRIGQQESWKMLETNEYLSDNSKGIVSYYTGESNGKHPSIL